MRVYQIENDKEFRRFLPPKYEVIYDLGVATGLRISDIISLKKSALTIEKPTIIEQKTKKSNRIYIPKDLRRKLEKIAAASDTEYIFGSISRSGHISRQCVYKQFKKAARAAEIKRVGTHSMRKKYAKKQAKKGLAHAQKKLNHSNIAETALYTIEGEK